MPQRVWRSNPVGARPAGMAYEHDQHIKRSIEQFLAPAYEEFERLLNMTYSRDTARQRLYTIRQFCRFLQNGDRPYSNYPPPPPKP